MDTNSKREDTDGKTRGSEKIGKDIDLYLRIK